MLTRASCHTRPAGFSLIELMVAMVIGLVVSGAALALIVSIMKSNADTLKATRLTQELRVTADVISRELRRARGVTDPIANIGLEESLMLKACDTIVPAAGDAAASCVRFAYDCSAANAGAFRAIGLVDGKVRLVDSGTALPSCPTSATGTQLSSDAIDITGLTFTPVQDDHYIVTVTGEFEGDPDSVSRSITEEVRIRSASID